MTVLDWALCLRNARLRSGEPQSHPDVVAWAPLVWEHGYYRWSCWSYSVLGVLVVLLHTRALSPYCPWFPWRVMGCTLMLQGYLSYMADVVRWGRSGFFQVADALLATLHTLVQMGFIVFQALDWSSWPPDVVVFYAVGIFVALFSKVRSTHYSTSERDATKFFIWHTAWHLSLPLAALIVIIYLDGCFAPAGCGAGPAAARAGLGPRPWGSPEYDLRTKGVPPLHALSDAMSALRIGLDK